MFKGRKFLVHSNSSLALFACLTLALLLGAGWCAATYAGKPAPPPPPPPVPPGKIFYGYFGHWQMNGDGSGKTALFTLPSDASMPVPSVGSYGTDQHRWWLVAKPSDTDSNATDVYATTNGQLPWIRLTSSGFTIDANGIETHLRVLGEPCWSNDGHDSFCSIRASHYVYDPLNNIVLENHRTIYRLNISATDLENGIITAPLHDGDPRLVPKITATIVSGGVSGDPLMQHHWSADNKKLTFVSYHSNNSPYPDLYVANVSDVISGPVNADSLIPIFYHTPNTYGVGSPRWSPHDITQPEQIAFDCGGYLFTVPPDGSVPNPVSLTVGSKPFWSPDGKFIAYRNYTFNKNRTAYYDIVRIPSAGGTIVNLTADLDRTINKGVDGWSE